MARPSNKTLIGYHAFDACHLDAVLEEGLHLRKSRTWASGILEPGQGVYMASTPARACRLGEPGAIAVCRIGADAVIADEDEVPPLLFEAVLKVGPAFGVVPYKEEDIYGKSVTTYSEPDLAAALRDPGGGIRQALADAFGQLCARRSSTKADPDLSWRMIEGWAAMLGRMRPYGGPHGGSIHDIPSGDPALRAYKDLEHEVCARHRDLGSHRKTYTFRSTRALGHDGADAVLAVLSRQDGEWYLERGELPDEALEALERIAPVNQPGAGPSPH